MTDLEPFRGLSVSDAINLGESVRKAIDSIAFAPVRICRHIIPPGYEVVLADPLPTDRVFGCAALCGASLVLRPTGGR